MHLKRCCVIATSHAKNTSSFVAGPKIVRTLDKMLCEVVPYLVTIYDLADGFMGKIPDYEEMIRQVG